MARTQHICALTAVLVWMALGLSVSVDAATATPDTIFGLAAPATVDSGDPHSVELGVKFSSEVAGTVTGIRFYKATANTGTHIGSLWSAHGTLLASATFTGETASGWQQMSFATPVTIAADTTYVAGYFAPKGEYSDTSAEFASAGVSSPPLTALANSVSANGVYAYSATSTFPASTYKATNYWVDVDFEAASAPGQVSGVSATPGNTSASVQWSAPSSAASPITSYTVTPYVGATAQPATTVSGSPPATGTTVTGLTNGTSYTFTVAAVNTDGAGPASEHSPAVTPATTPSAPTNVTATAGTESATVKWAAPSNGGSQITSYTITPYVGAEAQPTTTLSGSPPATSTTIAGLTDGTSYTFTVQASNADGSGPASSPSNAATPTVAANPLAMDANVTVEGHGTTTTPGFSTAEAGEQLLALVGSDGPAGAGRQSVTVSGAGLAWTLVERANSRSGDTEIWTATASKALANVAVTSTPAVGGYDQSLTVVSIERSSGIGAAVAGGAASGAPSVQLTTSGERSLVYAVGNDWDTATPRTLGPGQVVLHQYLDTKSADTYWSQYTAQATGPAGSVVTLNDTAPTADQWNMAAVEIVGQPAAAPGQVTGVSARAGNGSATVEWSAPSDGASRVTSYTITPYVGTEAQPATTIGGSPPATSATVAGLIDGTSYTFTVRASDAAGAGPASELSNVVTPTGGTTPDPTLLGEETAFSTYGVGQNGAAILAWPFTAGRSGTIEALHIYVLGSTAAIEGVELGIYENDTYSFAEPFEAYGEKAAFWEASGLAPESPGTLLAAKYVATGGHPKTKWVEATGYSVKVTAGKQYWLAVLTRADENGQDLVYGKKSDVKEAKPWGNYSNEWSLARKMETLPPPPAVKEMKEPAPGWQQEEPAGYEFQAGREAQEEGGPPSLYASGSE
jgi:Domain of unknown function (DUF4082)/Fibronectin type III domain